MRKLREKLNKKGFTLVELIVVIVIVLILAAVLVPNVMKYIDDAKKSAFQAEASGYLTELQAEEAKTFASTGKDLGGLDASSSSSVNVTLKGLTVQVAYDDADITAVGALNDGAKANVKNGVVYGFSYSGKTHYVTWNQSKGWTAVDSTDWPTS